MTRQQQEVWELVRLTRVVSRRDHPELASAMAWLRRTGELVSVLPGVYSPPGDSSDLQTRVRALHAWAPDAVLTDEVAARLSFWPEIRVGDVSCSARSAAQVRGFRFERRIIPPELVTEVNGLRLTVPALTALDLCRTSADGIDHVLLARAATLPDLWEALRLTAGRRGNLQRLEMLVDSRDKPWSAAERLTHRILREHGLTGWEANLPTVIGGQPYFLDIGFEDERLAVEIDGRFHDLDRSTFESDRERQNALVLAGWTVLRFTWRKLQLDPAGVVRAVETMLYALRTRRSIAS